MGPQAGAHAAANPSCTHCNVWGNFVVPTAVMCVPVPGQPAGNSSVKMECSGSGSAWCCD